MNWGLIGLRPNVLPLSYTARVTYIGRFVFTTISSFPSYPFLPCRCCDPLYANWYCSQVCSLHWLLGIGGSRMAAMVAATVSSSATQMQQGAVLPTQQQHHQPGSTASLGACRVLQGGALQSQALQCQGVSRKWTSRRRSLSLVQAVAAAESAVEASSDSSSTSSSAQVLPPACCIIKPSAWFVAVSSYFSILLMPVLCVLLLEWECQYVRSHPRMRMPPS